MYFALLLLLLETVNGSPLSNERLVCPCEVCVCTAYILTWCVFLDVCAGSISIGAVGDDAVSSAAALLVL